MGATTGLVFWREMYVRQKEFCNVKKIFKHSPSKRCGSFLSKVFRLNSSLNILRDTNFQTLCLFRLCFWNIFYWGFMNTCFKEFFYCVKAEQNLDPLQNHISFLWKFGFLFVIGWNCTCPNSLFKQSPRKVLFFGLFPTAKNINIVWHQKVISFLKGGFFFRRILTLFGQKG